MAPHQDKNPWSFVVALNDEYEGGGTFFVNEEAVYRPNVGDSIIFYGHQLHGAYTITSGTRYILAGFCSGLDTHEEFMSDYDPQYDGFAAQAGFRTGDLIIGIEDCGHLEESTSIVAVTPTMTDTEWTRLAQSCEIAKPNEPSIIRVRRHKK